MRSWRSVIAVCVGLFASACAPSLTQQKHDAGVGVTPEADMERPVERHIASGRDRDVDPPPSDAERVEPAQPALPSLPLTLRIHPLTRVATDADAKPAIILHLEAKDAYGQIARIRGSLAVELRVGTQFSTWRIDLSDPSRNALLFDDLVTRTYTIALGAPPETLLAWSRRDLSVSPTPTLRVRYTPEAPRAAPIQASAALTR